MEHCSGHDQLVEDIGNIKGSINALLEGQRDYKETIKTLTDKVGELKVSSAVEKTKIQPFYIVLGIITVLVVTKIGERVVLTIMKLFPFFKD